jgi:glycosyltransferase involved in cell wall biosynthesis
MRVVVFTTSYPRGGDDFVGRFVSDAVEQLRVRGVDVEVVKPGDYRDFGLAYGAGVFANARRRPWLALPMVVSMIRTLRRAAAGADLVHAHWLAGAFVARFARKPFVVTLHGTGSAGRFSDAALARSVPRLVRRLLRPARAVICVSEGLASAVRAAGVERVVVIPNGVRIPDEPAEPAEPPEVLYVGRLSPEKNIDTLVEASAGLNLVVAGDGPLRHLVPTALGAVSNSEVERLFERATVVVAPCHVEGFGLAAVEAMAFGRPVVAAAGGGLLDIVVDGETGIFVRPRDAADMRRAIEELLAEPERGRRLGQAGRKRARERFGWETVTERTLDVYRGALA